jgi:hypothetical protein
MFLPLLQSEEYYVHALNILPQRHWLLSLWMILVDQPTYQGSVGPEHCSTDPAFLTHNLEYVLLKKLSYPCSNSCLLAF